MELLVVGSGAAYPDRPGTASSTYVVEHRGAGICLDLGQGGFAGIAGRVEPSTLDAVVVSHLHPDHFVDLVALRHYLRYEFEPPRRMRVLAPAGLADRLDALLAEPGFAAAALDVEPRREGTVRDRARSRSRAAASPTPTRATRCASRSPTSRPRPASSTPATAGEPTISRRSSGPATRSSSRSPSGPGRSRWATSTSTGPAVGALAAATRPGRVLLTHLQMRRDPRRGRRVRAGRLRRSGGARRRRGRLRRLSRPVRADRRRGNGEAGARRSRLLPPSRGRRA